MLCCGACDLEHRRDDICYSLMLLKVLFTAVQINPDWVKTAARPFDPPLTEHGEEQVLCDAHSDIGA